MIKQSKPPHPWDQYTYDATFDYNHDGDTPTLLLDQGLHSLQKWPVRLLGVQCPEVAGHDVGPDEMKAGDVSKMFLSSMLSNAAAIYVQTVKDELVQGRYLGRVFVYVSAQWMNVSDLLIQHGLGCKYDGNGKAPKWTGPGRWTRADGVAIDANGNPIP